MQVLANRFFTDGSATNTRDNGEKIKRYFHRVKGIKKQYETTYSDLEGSTSKEAEKALQTCVAVYDSPGIEDMVPAEAKFTWHMKRKTMVGLLLLLILR